MMIKLSDGWVVFLSTRSTALKTFKSNWFQEIIYRFQFKTFNRKITVRGRKYGFRFRDNDFKKSIPFKSGI
jgi:hypothetical protein